MPVRWLVEEKVKEKFTEDNVSQTDKHYEDQKKGVRVKTPERLIVARNSGDGF